MCEPTTIMLALSVASAAAAAKGQYDQNKFQSGVAKNNATMAERQARDAERRGEEEAQRINRQTSQLKGSQRASLAARGLDLGAGTPGDLIDQTDFFGATDAAMARTNGRTEAWMRRGQGANFSAEAANSNATQAAGLSLLGSAGNVAGKWYAYGGTGGADPAFKRYTKGNAGSGD